MKSVANEKVLFCDVDETLILWESSGKGNEVSFTDPYSKEVLTVYKHDNNIRLIKEKAKRGYCIIVWSQGGWAHAKAVVQALKLQAYVDIIMSKPTCYVDDKPVCDWFPRRVWLSSTARYKDES